MRLTLEKPPTTPFELAVHRFVQSVPVGRVTTYGDVALAVGRPGAARAVGNVMRCNPDTKVTPCHRVVRSNGNVGGYGGTTLDVSRKLRRLKEEGVAVGRDGMVRDFEAIRYPA